jgi:DNA-binding response OmpR family regulator
MSTNDNVPKATIFLIEEDDDTRPILRSNLKRYGYRVLLALDEEDALERSSGGGARADLILVNLIGKTPEESMEVAKRIRHRGEYADTTPLVVLAEKFGKELEGTDARVGDNEWITYLEDGKQLEALLARLLSV